MWIPYIQGDGWSRDLPAASDVQEALHVANAEARYVPERVCVCVRRTDVPRPNVGLRVELSKALAGMGTHGAVRTLNVQMGAIRRNARRVKE